MAKGLQDRVHEADTFIPAEARRPGWLAEVGAGWMAMSTSPATPVPSWLRLRRWQYWRLRVLIGTLRQAGLLADPESEGGGETLLWFCGQEGNILRIFRGWTGSCHAPPAPPPSLRLPALSHWNMPFEKCLHFLSVLGHIPATLIESGKGGLGREGEGHQGEKADLNTGS